MDVSHLLDDLNAAQREAVSAPPGHYLVLAGAGSGKTRVLTHRIAWLIEVQGVPAHGILAVTFTNKAAGEMRARADAQLRHGARGMWIGTFHGIAHRLLRLHWNEARLPESFQVLDSDDQLRLVKRVAQQLELDDGRFPPRQIAWWINAQKDEGRRPEHIQPGDDPWTDALRRAYALYQERCDRAGLVDFAELLLRAHELLRDNPALLGHYRARFRDILVDEFQDTNAIQYAFVRVLAGDSGRVFVVGDWRMFDTRIGLILLYCVFNLPFAIWLLKGMVDAIPVELDEAAMLDGAGTAQIILKVIVPLARPGIAVTAILAWVFAWNEYLFAATLTSVEARTITTGLAEFVTVTGTNWGEMAAVAMLTLLPAALFVGLVQRHIVAGLTFGALKD